MHGADFERQILSAHLSVRVPTTSRSAHAPLDFLNPALRSAPLKSVFGQLRSQSLRFPTQLTLSSQFCSGGRIYFGLFRPSWQFRHILAQVVSNDVYVVLWLELVIQISFFFVWCEFLLTAMCSIYLYIISTAINAVAILQCIAAYCCQVSLECPLLLLKLKYRKRNLVSHFEGTDDDSKKNSSFSVF